jgi:inner membrane protein
MSPVTHFFASWLVANTARLERRERALVTLAGVAPDLDGLGIVPELLTRNSRHPLLWFSEYHHVLGHNLGFALVVSFAALAVAKRSRLMTAALAFTAFHLHLLCDLVGARGPEGEQWAIPYLAPFSQHWQLAWHGQWALNTWPNFVITFVVLVATFYLAWLRGYSPLEMISTRADRAFVSALRKRFPHNSAINV